MHDNADTSWPLWHDAARRPAVDAAIRTLYARLDADVAARGPTCWVSGKCCNFDAFGHRLYVTALEIAWFLQQVAPSPGVDRQAGRDATSVGGRADATLPLPQLAAGPAEPDAPLPAACVYQVDGLCTTHVMRPLGCRIFFCQQGTEHWQNELYEQYLSELRTLHERHGLPYRYLEWRAGLVEARAATSRWAPRGAGG